MGKNPCHPPCGQSLTRIVWQKIEHRKNAGLIITKNVSGSMLMDRACDRLEVVALSA